MAKKCPFFSEQCDDTCALWCDDDKVCAIKKVAIELVKLGETQ
jgi:hypothetical protein